MGTDKDDELYAMAKVAIEQKRLWSDHKRFGEKLEAMQKRLDELVSKLSEADKALFDVFVYREKLFGDQHGD